VSALQFHGPSDEELARRTGAGDVDAFEQLYRRYAGPLTAYAGRLLRDRVAAEDAAQVALLNAYQALRRGSSPSYTRAWLFRITRNVALEAIERRDDVTPLDDRVCAADPHEAHEARDDLLAALRTLPDRQRMVFVLRELQGLRIREISDRLALTTEQVEQALFAARNRLAEYLTFGERIDCASVQSLDAARLSRAERRAIKSHLRACPSCRTSSTRLRGGVLLLPLDWARNAALALFGGGGAAKAAAAGAAAAAVGATPIVADELPSSTARAAVPSRVIVEPAPPRAARETRREAPQAQGRHTRQTRDAAIPVVVAATEDQSMPIPAAPAEISAEPADAPPAVEPEPEPEPIREPAAPAAEPEQPDEVPVEERPQPEANVEEPAVEEPTRPEKEAEPEPNLDAEPYETGLSNR